MTTDGLNGVVGRLRRTAATNIAAGRTDGDLLGDFIDRCDPTAFDSLVRRHGPMVLGVCKRLLGSRQDAEDAFQAVFLVLVLKASSIAHRDMVGKWLYGVAHQTAVRVRALNLKRQQRERQMAALPEPESKLEPGWDDLRPVLDEEMSRLPDRYRSVLVLCDVEGRTRKDAARHLKCPEGSVSSRLARARTMLSKRLARRGIALSGGATAVLISEHAAAHIPNALLDSTLQCATAALAGTTAKSVGMLAAGQVPQKVSLIAKGVLGAMAIKKTIATGMLVTAFVLGTTTCGLVARHLQAGQDSSSPGEEPKKSATAEVAKVQTSAEELVKQLDSNEFQKREAAEKALVALGAKALPAVRAGTKSSSPEVAQRCKRLLPLIRQAELAQFVRDFTADTEHKAKFDHPIWVRYVSMVGDSKPSRTLFARIVKRLDWLSQLDAADADPANAGEIYREALRDVGKRTMSNLSVWFLIPIWPCDQPEEVAYLMLLGSYKNTDPVGNLSFNDMPSRHFAEGEGRIKFAKGIGLALQGKRLAIDPKKGDRSIEVEDGGGNVAESARVMLMLLAHWLEQRNLWIIVSEHVRDLSDSQKKQLLPFARRVVADKNAAVLCRAFWISIVRRFGDSSDAVRLAPLFEDKTGMDWPTVNRFGEGPGNVINQAQVREVAIGSAIYLRGRDPIDFGFTGLTNEPRSKREDEIHSTRFTVNPTEANDAKEKLLAKAIEWLGQQARKEEPPAPKKLPRAAEPPPELQAELARMDGEYRQGSEEKYLEFETKAAELCKKFPEKENQARIWFHVAHVASQGGINKHVERVRKYGKMMLALSQDPLERGTMYSYLASTYDVDSTVKTFEEKRRLGADYLLQGYAELLVQELPAIAPERPPLGPIRNVFEDDPNKRGENQAKQQAMLDAYNQARFVEDLIFRRDTLLLQLRGLYRPSLVQFDRTAEGLDELRSLATKKLKSKAAVDALLEKIVGLVRQIGEQEAPVPKWAVKQFKDDMVQISVGHKQGLKVGDILYVNRAGLQSDRVGKIQIITLDNDEAIGRLTESDGKVKIGDVVSHTPPPEFDGAGKK